MNVVMKDGGAFVEVQGTAEGHAFRRHELDALLDLAAGGIASCSHCSARRGRTEARAMRVVLATGNPGKLREFADLLGPAREFEPALHVEHRFARGGDRKLRRKCAAEGAARSRAHRAPAMAGIPPRGRRARRCARRALGQLAAPCRPAA